jgi:hypothetical protein
MAQYIDCGEKCKCDIIGGPDEDAPDKSWVYTASSDTNAPCKKREDLACKCFVVASVQWVEQVPLTSCITGKTTVMPIMLSDQKIYTGDGKADGSMSGLTNTEVAANEAKHKGWNVSAKCFVVNDKGVPYTRDAIQKEIEKLQKLLK